MNLQTFIDQSSRRLNGAGISSPRLDTLLLIGDVLGQDKAWLLAHPEFELTQQQITELDGQIERRVQHEPIAYIRGKSEFFGREFIVTPDTLQPRPETETIVELLLSQSTNKQLKAVNIIDIGTGSGCIAITAKLELPETRVFATDISDECLAVARKNAKNLDADIQFYCGNLLEPLSAINYQQSTIVLANLPYVPDSFQINQAAMHEPKLAIFGGHDGLDYYRQMFKQIDALGDKPASIFTESLPPQHPGLQQIAEQHGYSLRTSEDFIQVFIRE